MTMIITDTLSTTNIVQHRILQNLEFLTMSKHQKETMAGSLKLITWNTCGIRDTADVQQKKEMICHWLNEQQASVAFLQETHIGVNDVQHVEDIRGWKAFYSVHHPRSKGVAILIKNDLPFEHIKHDVHPTGSYIVLICKLYSKCFTLVNVYNHAKEHKVLQCLSEYLYQTAKGVLIVAGDFNTVLNPDLDREYPTGHTEPLRPYLEEFISSLMLVDIWGQNNPYEKDSFTRFPWKTSKWQIIKKTSGQKKTKKKRGASRLDMVFMPRNEVWLAKSCEISKVPRHNISDHHPVVLSLCLPKPNNTTVLSCSSGLGIKKRPYKRRAGEISEAEVLKALMSLVAYESPLGENVQTLKINKEQKSQELKELFNKMIRGEIPKGFTDSVKENGRYHFGAEYMILATIFLRRIEKFLQPSFKSKTMKMSRKLFIIVSFRSKPKKIKRDFLRQALTSLKPIHPLPPRDFEIVEKLLPSTDQYKKLREGCPLTPTLLTMALKHLACALKKDLKESVVDVCHHRKCITIYMNADQYHILKQNINKFQLHSGISLLPKVG
ncbi:uncharacterized protein LOC125243678 [Megalobrama amblycephala]|uniref:uncharacterized protein LOC125243678 n=1 Tax=Megalobrama amblycephala TaxID=75352 RepID=UPI002013FEC2|nr:uncharacterized protein LOC125243678 [Megalobrama amblycephala]